MEKADGPHCSVLYSLSPSDPWTMQRLRAPPTPSAAEYPRLTCLPKNLTTKKEPPADQKPHSNTVKEHIF